MIIRKGSDNSTLRWIQAISHTICHLSTILCVCEVGYLGLFLSRLHLFGTEKSLLMEQAHELLSGSQVWLWHPKCLRIQAVTIWKWKLLFISEDAQKPDVLSCSQSASWVLWFAGLGFLVSHWIGTSEFPRQCEAGRAGPRHLLQQMSICTFHLGNRLNQEAKFSWIEPLLELFLLREGIFL